MEAPPKLDRQALLREVAKRHHLVLDESDPVLATVTLHELLLEHTLEQVQAMLTTAQERVSAGSSEQMAAAKETASRLITESAEYIDQRIQASVTQAEGRLGETMMRYLAQAQQTLKDTRWAATAAIAGGALMLGIGIGAFLARH